MTQTPTSEGLRRFHEVCEAPAPPEVFNRTWYDHARWVQEHVPQESLERLYPILLDELLPINQAEEDSPQGQLAEHLYGTLDIVWYAMSEETIARVEARSDERLRVEDPERWKEVQENRARLAESLAAREAGAPEAT